MTRVHPATPPAAIAVVAVLAWTVSCSRADSARAPQAVAGDGATNPCHDAQPPYSRFELAVLGSGGPAGFGRGASTYAVFIDGTARLLVDAGPGAFVRLGEMGVDLARLDTVLLTHLHVDHAGDLPGFVKSRDLASSEARMTFRIFGPSGGGDFPGTSAFVDLLFGPSGAFRYLPLFRNHLSLATTDLPTRADAPIHEVLREGDLRVTSIAVDHDDAPAVAFRVEHAGRALVISGDLASRNDNLTHLAAGADLLVYDTTVLDPPDSPRVLYDLHTPPRRIGEVAAAAGVKSLLLSHLTPSVLKAEDAVFRSIRASYKGELHFAEDCLRIPLLPGE
jgi:ribonuclease BN (tRNA processing enzyme)